MRFVPSLTMTCQDMFSVYPWETYSFLGGRNGGGIDLGRGELEGETGRSGNSGWDVVYERRITVKKNSPKIVARVEKIWN